MNTNRRTILIGAAAVTAAPAAAYAQGASSTPIAKLWAEVEACERALAPHKAAMADAEALRGVTSGWMYLTGEAHQAGQRRYDALVAILKEAPRTDNDLVILAKACCAPDMANGPRAWASERFAQSVMTYHMAA